MIIFLSTQVAERQGTVMYYADAIMLLTILVLVVMLRTMLMLMLMTMLVVVLQVVSPQLTSLHPLC